MMSLTGWSKSIRMMPENPANVRQGMIKTDIFYEGNEPEFSLSTRDLNPCIGLIFYGELIPSDEIGKRQFFVTLHHFDEKASAPSSDITTAFSTVEPAKKPAALFIPETSSSSSSSSTAAKTQSEAKETVSVEKLKKLCESGIISSIFDVYDRAGVESDLDEDNAETETKSEKSTAPAIIIKGSCIIRILQNEKISDLQLSQQAQKANILAAQMEAILSDKKQLQTLINREKREDRAISIVDSYQFLKREEDELIVENSMECIIKTNPTDGGILIGYYHFDIIKNAADTPTPDVSGLGSPIAASATSTHPTASTQTTSSSSSSSVSTTDSSSSVAAGAKRRRPSIYTFDANAFSKGLKTEPKPDTENAEDTEKPSENENEKSTSGTSIKPKPQ